MGLISIEHQVLALAGKLIIWILLGDQQPMQRLRHARLRELSTKKFRMENFSWCVLQNRTLPKGVSKIWLNLCKSWSTLIREIIPAEINSVAKWRALPIWTLQVNHKQPKLVHCSTIPQCWLYSLGLTLMKEVTTEREVLPWGRGLTPILPVACKNAYCELIDNPHLTPQLSQHNSHRHLVHMQHPQSPQSVWEFDIEKCQTEISWAPPTMMQPTKSYTVIADLLKSDHTIQVLPPRQLTRALIAAGKDKEGRKTRRLLGTFDGELQLLTQYVWRDGKSFFDTSTAHLRHLLSSAPACHLTEVGGSI